MSDAFTHVNNAEWHLCCEIVNRKMRNGVFKDPAHRQDNGLIPLHFSTEKILTEREDQRLHSQMKLRLISLEPVFYRDDIKHSCGLT